MSDPCPTPLAPLAPFGSFLPALAPLSRFNESVKGRTIALIKPYEIAMAIETSKLTIRLPVEDIVFVKRYAKANGLSVTEVIDRYLRRMRLLDSEAPPAALDEITGLLPPDIDVSTEIDERRLSKHGR